MVFNTDICVAIAHTGEVIETKASQFIDTASDFDQVMTNKYEGNIRNC